VTAPGPPVLGLVVQAATAVLGDELGLLRGAEDLDARPRAFAPLVALQLLVDLLQLIRVGPIGQVVDAEHHVLGRGRQRRPVGRREDVVGGEHEDPRLGLGLGGERHVDRHLIAVEVGVEGVADQGVHLDRLALDQDRFERLDAETVQGRSSVEQDRVFVDDFLEHIPDLRDH
jgi:hypothetical protein